MMASDKEHIQHCTLFQLKKNAAEAAETICCTLDEGAVAQMTCANKLRKYKSFREVDSNLEDWERPD